MIWHSGQTTLFLFLLAEAFLPTALSVALRPLFPFRQAQYAQVFPLKPAPFCTLFAGLSSINKSAIFLLSSYCLTLLRSSPPYPLLHLSSHLTLCGRSGRNCVLFPLVLSDYNGSPDTCFSQGTTLLTSWLDRERYLHPLQSLVVSLLLSLVSTLIFSDWRHTVSSKFFDTQVPSISTEKLVLPCHARSRLCCNGHSFLLGSYLSRIGRIENPSCSACGQSSQDISHLVLHCPATDSALLTLWRLSVSLRPLVQTLGSCPASGTPWSPVMPPIPRKGSVTNNNNNRQTLTRKVVKYVTTILKPWKIHGDILVSYQTF